MYVMHYLGFNLDGVEKIMAECCKANFTFTTVIGLDTAIQKAMFCSNMCNMAKAMKGNDDSFRGETLLKIAKDYYNCNMKDTSFKWRDIKKGVIKV